MCTLRNLPSWHGGRRKGVDLCRWKGGKGSLNCRDFTRPVRTCTCIYVHAYIQRLCCRAEKVLASVLNSANSSHGWWNSLVMQIVNFGQGRVKWSTGKKRSWNLPPLGNDRLLPRVKIPLHQSFHAGRTHSRRILIAVGD